MCSRGGHLPVSEYREWIWFMAGARGDGVRAARTKGVDRNL